MFENINEIVTLSRENGYTFFDRAKPMHMSQAKKRRKIYIRKARRQAKEMA